VETGRDALAGLRILIVEDEFLVAMLVEEMLQDLRCEIVGPVSTLEEAVATVRQNRLDGALLDANLSGKNSSPVADELLGHEVPFILVTGYGGHKGDPPVLKRAPRVRKPVNFDELADRMTEVFVRRPAER
jgi:DNA-binding response OmpR family regulator